MAQRAGGGMYLVTLVSLVVALTSLGLHVVQAGAGGDTNDVDLRRLSEVMTENKKLSQSLSQSMMDVVAKRQSLGCTPELYEKQKFLTRRAQEYVREVAVTVVQLYNVTTTILRELNTDMCNRDCQANEWKCKNGKCIALSRRCDGQEDCSDASDESPVCLAGCGSGLFRCTRDNTCIPGTMRCNGVNECSDGADENCQINCQTGEFLCRQDLRCIPFRWTCDGATDCTDASDEALCSGGNVPTTTQTPQAQCSANQILCAPANRCLPASSRCNGFVECSDSSDEAGCPVVPPRLSPCNQQQFWCVTENICIALALVCDGTNHCSDGLDERNCPATTTLPTGCNGFMCPSGRCIPMTYVCDGFADCFDTSDEMNCRLITNPPPVTCSSLEYKCINHNLCIPLQNLCNGVADCPDGTDEICTASTPGLRLDINTTTSALVPITFTTPTTTTPTTTTTTTTTPTTTPTTTTTTLPQDQDMVPVGACPSGYFECQKGWCLPVKFLCKPFFRCKNESLYCQKSCRKWQFRCPENGRCVPACDGRWDCYLGRDEWKCGKWG